MATYFTCSTSPISCKTDGPLWCRAWVSTVSGECHSVYIHRLAFNYWYHWTLNQIAKDFYLPKNFHQTFCRHCLLLYRMPHGICDFQGFFCEGSLPPWYHFPPELGLNDKLVLSHRWGSSSPPLCFNMPCLIYV